MLKGNLLNKYSQAVLWPYVHNPLQETTNTTIIVGQKCIMEEK